MADGEAIPKDSGAEALRDRWIPRTRVIARRERAAREAERKEKRSEDAGS